MEKDYLSSVDSGILVQVFSLLSPVDLAICACVCKRFHELHEDDTQLWLPACLSRWGKYTNPKEWIKTYNFVGGVPEVREAQDVCLVNGFRALYGVLEQWDNLIGYWRVVGNSGLIVIQWGSSYVEAFKINGKRLHSYEVDKVSLLQSGISSNGRVLSVLSGALPSQSRSPETKNRQNSSSRGSEGAIKHQTSSVENEFLELLRDPSLVVSHNILEVTVCIEGQNLIAIESASRPSTAFLETPVHPPEIVGSPPIGLRSPARRLSCSPPVSLPYEMYSSLASRVPQERPGSRTRRRYKPRTRGLSPAFETEHLLRIPNHQIEPRKDCPLQGLWKGILPSGALDFVLIEDNEGEILSCRRVVNVEEPSGNAEFVPMKWNSPLSSALRAPISELEQSIFRQKRHIEAIASNFEPQSTSSQLQFSCTMDSLRNLEVSGSIPGCSYQDSTEISAIYLTYIEGKAEGNVWLYSNGVFGYGRLQSDVIVDYCRMVVGGRLADVFE